MKIYFEMEGHGIFLLLSFFISVFVLSQIFRFYVKLCIYYAIVFFCALLPLPLVIFRPRNVKNTNVVSFFAVNLTRVFSVAYEINGLERLAKDESAVIVCNHQSALDLMTMMYLWPRIPKCAAVIKKELLYAGPFGICAWLCGHVFIDRSDSLRAKKSLDNAIDCLTDKKIKLWFFPEGTRNDSGTMLPFKKGAFHLAIQAQRPILPITVSNYSSFYKPRIQKFDNGGKIIINILPSVSTEGFSTKDLTTLMTTVRNQMEKSMEKDGNK